MAKISRDIVVREALDLLDEVGLDAVSTRRLADRVGVEQPSLYWHFRRKSDLLGAMAEEAMRPHALEPLPQAPQAWQEWFAGNYRSFRSTLLLRRDGARLHAGHLPGPGDAERVAAKLRFLVASGVRPTDARMAMLAAGRYTVGSVLEEQADVGGATVGPTGDDGSLRVDHAESFDAGLALIVDGLAGRAAGG